jgi:hypothetical protein
MMQGFKHNSDHLYIQVEFSILSTSKRAPAQILLWVLHLFTETYYAIGH